MGKKVDRLKQAGSFIVSVGVGTIVSNAIKATTPPHVRMLSKICIWAGGAALSGMLSDKASRYTEDKIDSALSEAKTIVEEVKDEKTEKVS